MSVRTLHHPALSASERQSLLIRQECEIVTLITQRHKDNESAHRVKVSEGETCLNFAPIFNKLSVCNRPELIIYYSMISTTSQPCCHK
jgi:hypothetical protein